MNEFITAAFYDELEKLAASVTPSPAPSPAVASLDDMVSRLNRKHEAGIGLGALGALGLGALGLGAYAYNKRREKR